MAGKGGGFPLKKPLEILGKYKYALLVAAAGALLLLWPGRDSATSQEGEAVLPAEASVSVRETEEALEALLGSIEGVGRVEVMLTLQSGTELVLAEDTSLRYSGSVKEPEDYERTNQPVQAGGEVVVRQEKYPQYRGAVVVCDGGGSNEVKLRVVEAVTALTGLGADRVSVAPRQAGGGAS